MNIYDSIAMRCQSYLSAYDHPSMRDERDKRLKRLYDEITKFYKSTPVTLEVQSVSVTPEQLFGGKQNG